MIYTLIISYISPRESKSADYSRGRHFSILKMNPHIDEKLMEKVWNIVKDRPELFEFARELSVLAGNDPVDMEMIGISKRYIIYKFVLSGRIDHILSRLAKDQDK